MCLQDLDYHVTKLTEDNNKQGKWKGIVKCSNQIKQKCMDKISIFAYRSAANVMAILYQDGQYMKGQDSDLNKIALISYVRIHYSD